MNWSWARQSTVEGNTKDYFGNMPIYIDQDAANCAVYGLYESKASIFYAFVGDGVWRSLLQRCTRPAAQ